MNQNKLHIFTKLATLTGEEVDLGKVSKEFNQSIQITEGDQIESLVQTAKKMHLTIVPAQLEFFRALWKATEDIPIVIWNNKTNDWELITKAGLLTVRVAEGESPEERVTIFHNNLQKRLGLKSRKDIIEVGIVQRSLPAASSSTYDNYGKVKPTVKKTGQKPKISPERRFIRMLLEDRKDIVTLMIFSIFSGVLYLTVPLAVDTVVSNLAYGAQSRPYIQALIILGQVVMGCLALQAIITGFQYYISDVIQRRIFARTTADIAYRLPRAQAQNFDNVHAPELVNRFLDVVTAQKNTAYFLLDGVNALMSTLVGMVLLSLYHPFLLVFVTILIIIIFFIIRFGGKGAVETSIIESKSKYKMLSWFEEIASYPIIFKGPGGYDLATNKANRLATDYVNARSLHFKYVIRQVTSLLLLSVLASVLLLLGGAWLVISQQITLGQLVASEIIMSGIIASLAKLGKKLETWYDTMAAMDKLGELWDLKMEDEGGSELKYPQKHQGCAIKASKLGFGFKGEPPLFQDISFDFQAGSKIAVLGSYGAGISAFLDLFFILRQPNSGYISVNSVDVRDWNIESYRQSVLLLRPNHILGTSIIDNLRLGRLDIGIDEINRALKKVGLLETLLNQPEGLKRKLNVGGAKMPKDQRISLLIARALVQRPSLLMIDELFDGLEESVFERLNSLIFDPNQPWTVLMSTRTPKCANLCDHIINLSPNSNDA